MFLKKQTRLWKKPSDDKVIRTRSEVEEIKKRLKHRKRELMRSKESS